MSSAGSVRTRLRQSRAADQPRVELRHPLTVVESSLHHGDFAAIAIVVLPLVKRVEGLPGIDVGTCGGRRGAVYQLLSAIRLGGEGAVKKNEDKDKAKSDSQKPNACRLPVRRNHMQGTSTDFSF